MKFFIVIFLLFASTINSQDLDNKYIRYADERKNEVAAGLMSFLIPGAGNFYADNYDAGLIFLAGSGIMAYLTNKAYKDANSRTFNAVIGGFIAVKIGDIYIASDSAKKYNDRLKKELKIAFGIGKDNVSAGLAISL